jgi:hypothetical protein
VSENRETLPVLPLVRDFKDLVEDLLEFILRNNILQNESYYRDVSTVTGVSSAKQEE